MKTQKIQRTFTGEVVSTKMNKTLVVRVDRTVVHPKYGKRYVQSRKFNVHDEHGSYEVGEKVEFQECRPISKTKCWRVLVKKTAN
ncbi:30S ribosomal protein S17 [Candidatus Uhrbacteria bacterium]|nr:30S ribosomal protein S17 [Candidatus Uhrbacteria bacterium]